MMEVTLQNTPELQGFMVPNVRPTGKPLGHGAYGSVEEVEIPGALCAAKKIHDTLLRMGSPDEVRNMTAKFVEECQLMSSLRHPHIVQFLGICFLPGSRIPALIMEKLLTSVDELLERTPNIPLSIKRGILHDVARGLNYLHSKSPPLIHRDLTAKNVLLNSTMVAKIADLGMARIVDIQPGQLAATMTQAPGTIVYMPPEALEPKARYDTKIDIFSLGNLAMYLLTQIFPELLAPTYIDPQTRRVIGRTEIERRIQYINQIHQQLGYEHPLVQMMEWCLENSPENRPTITQVLRQLEQARALIPNQYKEMNKLEMMKLLEEPLQQLEFKDQQIRDLQSEVQEKEAENQQALQALKEMEGEKRVQLQAKDREIKNLQAEVQARQQLLEEQEREKLSKDEQIRILQAAVQSSLAKHDPQQTELITNLLSQVQQLQLEEEELQARQQQQKPQPLPQQLHPPPGQQLEVVPQDRQQQKPHPPPSQKPPTGKPQPPCGQKPSPTKSESLDERSIPLQQQGGAPLPVWFNQLDRHTVYLQNITISDVEAESLSENLPINMTVETLWFDNVRLSANGLSSVLVALRENKSVIDLRLWNATISDSDVVDLAENLHVNTTIETLCLYGTKISDSGANALASASQGNKTLQTLSVDFQSVSDRGARDFTKKMERWGSSLKTLLIWDTTNISEEVKEMLRESAIRKGIGLSLN